MWPWVKYLKHVKQQNNDLEITVLMSRSSLIESNSISKLLKRVSQLWTVALQPGSPSLFLAEYCPGFVPWVGGRHFSLWGCPAGQAFMQNSMSGGEQPATPGMTFRSEGPNGSGTGRNSERRDKCWQGVGGLLRWVWVPVLCCGLDMPQIRGHRLLFLSTWWKFKIPLLWGSWVA